MSNEETASSSKLLELAGLLARHMPKDLSVEIVREWVDSPVSIRQFLAALQRGPMGLIQVRELGVTIYPWRTVEKWVEAGGYYCRNPKFSTENFDQFITAKENEAGSYPAKVVAFCIGRAVTLNRVRQIRSRLNLKPVGFEHLAAVGEQHPGVQQELKMLVNPDAVRLHPTGYQIVPTLCSGVDGNRYFTLNGAGGKWGANTWFLGLEE